ncbi:UspA domain-containing protein [Allomuricauda ruestringensis DSM 13258]|uniref:UspA domain-containing protein n=1 Tax=Allomuricauda ruestringensis (strain DSM 13258 / CIP 107369 / LMG 19739 / B1) TaxID=886377 RepID=G2PRP7_ALLRU|nr:universal stress protein [Allomuricauda ruestringensis]AEM69496.1 UspA domain-containing protein [Allomuricauda ruestringensis DSM 13258]
MKKVLLPTDFSQNAKNAIIYALKLYKDTPCTFYLLHAYGIPVYSIENWTMDFHETNPIAFYQKETMDQLNALKEELETDHANPKHKFVLQGAFNQLVDEIGEVVKKEGINLIVMGTKGVTGAKELLFGSNTVHTIKKTKCPLIAVPGEFKYESPKQILFPVDFEVDYDKKIIEEFLYLASENKGNINILHISTGNSMTEFQMKNKKKLEQLLEPHTYIFHETPINGVIEGINDFQKKNKINLLTMIMNKHTFLESLFIRPIIRKIGMHLNIPFMVLPHLEGK